MCIRDSTRAGADCSEARVGSAGAHTASEEHAVAAKGQRCGLDQVEARLVCTTLGWGFCARQHSDSKRCADNIVPAAVADDAANEAADDAAN